MDIQPLCSKRLTNHMELSLSWEATSRLATQELPQNLWYQMVHYLVHNNPRLVPILSHFNPVHTTPSYLYRIHFNIVLPSTSMPSTDTLLGTRGSVVGWGTMLQAGRSRVQVPMRSLDLFNWPNPSSRTMALGSTQPLTELSTSYIHGIFFGVKRGQRVGLTTLPPSMSRLSR
jgi:hypothetical protein